MPDAITHHVKKYATYFRIYYFRFTLAFYEITFVLFLFSLLINLCPQFNLLGIFHNHNSFFVVATL